MRTPITMPRYAVLVLIVLSALGPVGSIWASVRIADTSARELVVEREKAREQAAKEAKKLVCAYFSANLDAYDEVPPTTPAGKKQRQTNLDFYLESGCQPPRK